MLLLIVFRSMRFFEKLGMGIIVILIGTFLGFVRMAKDDFKAYRENRRNRPR
jgi:hypothetical protein